jgi:hypothetical protein
VKKIFVLLLLSLICSFGLTANSLTNIIYNNGNFIAGGQNSTSCKPVVKITQDGKKWSDATIDLTGSDSNCNNIYGIACNQEVCVAGLYSGKDILYSNNNGLNWKLVNYGFTNNSWSNIIYANNMFVMTMAANILYSNDGITWNKANLPSGRSYEFVGRFAYGNNMFLAITRSPVSLLVSRNGIDWAVFNTTNTPINLTKIGKVIFAEDAFYFATAGNTYHGLLYTPDLIFFGYKSPTKQIPYLEYHNKILFGTVNTQQPYSSKTSLSYNLGDSWDNTLSQTNPAMVLNHYAYGNGVYVYVNGVSLPAYSYDGINWVFTTW